MGIYIKGMEMPTSCAQCPFHNEDYRGEERCDIDWEKIGKAEEKPDWCPLISAPPHGRLIDADALLTYMFVGSVGADEHYIYRLGWNDALKAISANAPTIIAADEGETDNAKED